MSKNDQDQNSNAIKMNINIPQKSVEFMLSGAFYSLIGAIVTGAALILLTSDDIAEIVSSVQFLFVGGEP